MDGYKIIDFKGIDAGSGDTVLGAYNAIDTTTKPLVFCNIYNGSELIKPFFVGVYGKDESERYTFPIGETAIYVDKDDMVTIE